jgi:HEAT repeat protein
VTELPNIWLMQTQRDTQGLVRALKHTNPDVRRRAAAALRVIQAPNTLAALQVALQAETDSAARIAILAAMEFLMPIEAPPTPNEQVRKPQSRLERLIDHLNSNTVSTAVQAAHGLAEMKDLLAVPALIVVFRNTRKPNAVRLAAAEALLALNSAPAEVTLLAALRSEKWHLRRNGAAILGQLKAEWAVEPLNKALYDSNDLVARTARAALRRIGSVEARQVLDEAKPQLVDTKELNPDSVTRAQHQSAQPSSNQATLATPSNLSGISADQQAKATEILKPAEAPAKPATPTPPARVRDASEKPTTESATVNPSTPSTAGAAPAKPIAAAASNPAVSSRATAPLPPPAPADKEPPKLQVPVTSAPRATAPLPPPAPADKEPPKPQAAATPAPDGENPLERTRSRKRSGFTRRLDLPPPPDGEDKDLF